MVLDRQGQIIEQGSFEDLRSGVSYVQSLDISNLQMSDQEDEGDSVPHIDHSTEVTKDAPEEEPLQAPPTPSDRGIFAYYFASIRAVNIAIKICLVVGYSFVFTFRSVFPAALYYHRYLTRLIKAFGLPGGEMADSVQAVI